MWLLLRTYDVELIGYICTDLIYQVRNIFFSYETATPLGGGFKRIVSFTRKIGEDKIPIILATCFEQTKGGSTT